jgi:hypothetical protein
MHRVATSAPVRDALSDAQPRNSWPQAVGADLDSASAGHAVALDFLPGVHVTVTASNVAAQSDVGHASLALASLSVLHVPGLAAALKTVRS